MEIHWTEAMKDCEEEERVFTTESLKVGLIIYPGI